MLERGQLAASFRDIAGNFSVDVGVVRRLLDRLKNDTMIDTVSDTGVNVITICNYDKYQTLEITSDTVDDTPTDTVPTQYRHSTPRNALGEKGNSASNKGRIEEVNKIYDGFDEFWECFPSRSPHQNPKKPARQKFGAAVKRGVNPQDIIDGAKRYAAYVEAEGTDPKFIAQAVTWLNQERWQDVFDVKPERKL